MCAMDESRGVGNIDTPTILSNEVVVIEGAAFHQETLKPRQEDEEEGHYKPFYGIFRRVPINKVRTNFLFCSLLSVRECFLCI